MDDKTPGSVPYMVYESALARADRRLKWMWVLVIIVFLSLIVTNACWIIYENQFQDEITTIDATQDGSAVNIVGGGDINYGAESTNNEKEKNTKDGRQ